VQTLKTEEEVANFIGDIHIIEYGVEWTPAARAARGLGGLDECTHGSLRRSCEICERDAEIERLREAIFWACGVGGEFRLREDNEGAFWWRKELMERSGISAEELNRLALEEIEEVEGE
jgi:hypothetical protein